MSDSDEKQMPSNSSDISIEEIVAESEGHAVPKDDEVEVLIPQVLDDVSVGGRIEEIPAAGDSTEKAEVKHCDVLLCYFDYPAMLWLRLAAVQLFLCKTSS